MNQVTISKLHQMLKLWKQGDLSATTELETIFKEVKELWEKLYPVKDYEAIHKLIRPVSEFFIAGYEPALCFLEEEYGYVPYEEGGWGDYYNEFSHLLDYVRKNDLLGLQKRMRSEYIRRYEERYLGTFYDPQTKILTLSDDPRVAEINKIIDGINNHFEEMTLEEIDSKCERLMKIIYNR